MTNFINLNIQFAFSFILFYLIFSWYIKPRLSKLSFEKAIVPLLLVHVFRYTPLTLLVVGQTDPEIPKNVAEGIAYGDLISAILALIAALALKNNWKMAIPIVWAFGVFGFVDIINAFRLGVGAEFYNYFLGGGWYVLNYYTPILIITHIYIFYRLINRNKE